MKDWNPKNILLLVISMVALLCVSSCSLPGAPLPPITPSSNSESPLTPGQPPTSPTSNLQNEPRLEINLPGIKKEFPTNSRGELTAEVQMKSADGVLSLFIESGTSFQDKDGKPVYSVDIKANPGLPPELGNIAIIGTAYEFTPNGITCSRPIRLSLKYNPDSLTQGVLEKNIFVASYSEGKWNQLESKLINAEGYFAETQIDHFCWYTILGSLPIIATATPVISPAATTAVSNKVDLLYFHPSGRCVTCTYFEERIRYVMTTHFQKEMDSGQLTLTLFDYLDKANTDLVKKYKVVGSQLFIKTGTNGAENIRSIWEIYQWGSNKEAFDKGLRAIIRESLEGTK